MSDAELRRYAQTPAGAIKQAYGMRDPDPVAVARRAEEIRTELNQAHDAIYRESAPLDLSTAAAELVAVREQGTQMISGTALEIAARMRLIDPMHPWGVQPDYAQAGVGMLINGQEAGDPRLVAQLRQAIVRPLDHTVT